LIVFTILIGNYILVYENHSHVCSNITHSSFVGAKCCCRSKEFVWRISDFH